MTTTTAPHHQVATATAQMRDVADGVVDASVWSMNAPEAALTLVELTRLEVPGRRARRPASPRTPTRSRSAPTSAPRRPRTGSPTSTRQTRTAAFRTVHLGYDLGTYDRVRAGLAPGDLRPEQARVIITAVRRCRTTSTPTC